MQSPWRQTPWRQTFSLKADPPGYTPSLWIQTALEADPSMQTPLMQTPQSCDLWCLLGSQPPLWIEGMTHACENITLTQTSFAGGKNTSFRFWLGDSPANLAEGRPAYQVSTLLQYWPQLAVGKYLKCPGCDVEMGPMELNHCAYLFPCDLKFPKVGHSNILN